MAKAAFVDSERRPKRGPHRLHQGPPALRLGLVVPECPNEARGYGAEDDSERHPADREPEGLLKPADESAAALRDMFEQFGHGARALQIVRDDPSVADNRARAKRC